MLLFPKQKSVFLAQKNPQKWLKGFCKNSQQQQNVSFGKEQAREISGSKDNFSGVTPEKYT